MTFDLLNLLKSPLCFEMPDRITDVSSWHGHIPFAFAVMQMLQPKIFVELGTHKGDSYCAFCQTVKRLNLDCTCFAVDTWGGDEHAGFYGAEVYDELFEYHQPLYSLFSTLLKMRFDEASSRFSDYTIDLLHIDGLHSYDAVKHDFEIWLPKMSKQGVVLFHDTNVRKDGFGVWKLWEELRERFPYFEFLHSNGLGVLGVGNALPADIFNFLNMEQEKCDLVRDIFHSLGDNIVRMGQVNALKAKLNLREEYNRELKYSLEESRSEIKRRGQYVHQLEQKIEEFATEIERRGRYIHELEQQVEDGYAEVRHRGEYIHELEQVLKEFESSLICTKWVQFTHFIKPKI